MFKQVFSTFRTFASSPLLREQFESQIALKNIYPSSSLDIAKRYVVPSKEGEFNGFIPMDKMKISYSRSSGAGGQFVNKVNSKVDLRFELKSADWLPDGLKQKLTEKYSTYVNKEGYFVVKSERTRSQQLNLADCIDKLRHMIKEANVTRPVPTLKQLEVQRRRLEKASRERLQMKRERSILKHHRSGRSMEDES